MTSSLKIAVVEKDRERALLIVDSLRDAGDFEISVVGDRTGIGRKLSVLQPDVVLIDVEHPNRDVLEELALASGPLERPVAMFVDRTDGAMTKAAIEAGVSAYVVDGLRKERIKPIPDAAIARFRMFSRVRLEFQATKAALAERKDDRPREGPAHEGAGDLRGRGLRWTRGARSWTSPTPWSPPPTF